DRLGLYRSRDSAGNHYRLARPELGLAWRAHRSNRGRRYPGRARGRLFYWRGGVEGRWRRAAGPRLCDRLGAVRIPAADAVGNPVHAIPVRLVPGRGIAAVPIPGGGDCDGDRAAVGEEPMDAPYVII